MRNVTNSPNIAIIGLGYVGLPLAVSLANHFTVKGYDLNEARVKELKEGYDRTGEIEKEVLLSSNLKYFSSNARKDIDCSKAGEGSNGSEDSKDTKCSKGSSRSYRSSNDDIKTFDIDYNNGDQVSFLKDCDIYIVTVPTPINEDKEPDLTAVKAASKTLGKILSKGDIVVYESTVYPGVTEDICGTILENYSGMISGKDFYLGYSPERINPGDKKHTVDKIYKVISGQTREVCEQLKIVYGKINNDKIFVAKSIKVAEVAKVIENAQRDINIAFINEVATIVNKLGISVYDVF